jgi:hypothetical protein
MRKTAIISSVVGLFVGVFVGYYPKALPPDGTERHTWHVMWLTSSNTILVTEHPTAGKVRQSFYSDTASPRRNWGEQYIHYHWFRKPTFSMPPDIDGNRCIGEMVK